MGGYLFPCPTLFDIFSVATAGESTNSVCERYSTYRNGLLRQSGERPLGRPEVMDSTSLSLLLSPRTQAHLSMSDAAWIVCVCS